MNTRIPEEEKEKLRTQYEKGIPSMDADEHYGQQWRLAKAIEKHEKEKDNDKNE